jgi:hypothetical protein
MSKYDRIKRLHSYEKKINLDGLGSKRIANTIENLLKKNSFSVDYNNFDLVLTNDNIENQEYVIEAVCDNHINKYLDARNLNTNLRNMTEVNKVDRLNHYIWWFSNRRQSYILKKQGNPILYIWHESKTINDVKILIGGWFPCTENCAALDVMYALNWQLEYSKNHFPGIPWVAVIKKTNKFVLSLNKRFGFTSLSQKSKMFSITKECFPNASISKFEFVFKK